MTDLYLPHEIDPETVHVTVDVPFIEHLQELTAHAVQLARTEGKVVLIHHQHDEAHVTDEGVQMPEADYIGFRDYTPEFFNEGLLQCPRDADAEYEAQFNRPRPFPSMLVEEYTGKVAVSKSGLCDQCQWRVHRSMHGNCYGKRFEALPTVVK